MTSSDLKNLASKRIEDTWNEFLVAFPTESSCVEELFRRVFDRELSCLNCGSTFLKRIKNSRIIQCHDCKVESYTLAGTFFHNIRRARAWAGALWFMESGTPLNSCQLARLASISSSSAQKIFKDLALLLIRNLDDDSVMDSCSFVPVFNRRSRVTPAGQPPKNEEISLQENHEVVSSFEEQMNFVADVAAANGVVLDDVQWAIIKLLANQSCDEDEIVMRTGYDVGVVVGYVMTFRIYGIVESRDGRFVLKLPQIRKSLQMSEPACQLRTEFMLFVSTIFGSISRKYLQNYLGWFWSVVDRKSWTVNSIDAKFFRQGRMSLDDSRDYVSPRQVKCPLNFYSKNINSVSSERCTALLTASASP